MKPFAFHRLLLFATLLAAAPANAVDDVIISEFMAENDGTIEDEDGDSPDWIELYNAGTNTVSLGGWYLTDNAGDLAKWRFPATNMPPNSFLLVFASNKDRRTPGQPLHTSFRIDNDNGFVGLIKPDGATIASFFGAYPQQVAGVSYGVAVTATTLTLISNGSPARLTVPLNGTLGATWTASGFNDGSWMAVSNGVGFEAEPVPVASGAMIANSVVEFSGTQGQANWFYGYWDKKADGNNVYEAADFTAFPRGTGNVLASTNYWDGAKWDWPAGNPPWTEMTGTGVHPAGESGNPALPVHWLVRRYVSEVAGPLRLSGTLACNSTSGTCGDGVVGRIYVDGVEVYQQTVFGLSLGYSVLVNASVGSLIDFVIDPGPAQNDFCDTTTFTAVIHPAGSAGPVADTMADWSGNGVQGEKGWFYGFYDATADTVTPGYQSSNFVAFPSGTGPHSEANFWTGAEWQWFDGEPPYDTLGQILTKPSIGFPIASTNRNEHWVIRRWVSEVSGTLYVDLHAGKSDLTGTGVGIRILRNGTVAASFSLAAADFTGFTTNAVLSGVQAGDVIDLAVDPTRQSSVNDPIGDVAFLNAVIHAAVTLSNQFVSNIGGVMTNINASGYLRVPFTVADPAAIAALSLRMKYDDGFVAWVNGVLVTSRNAPETPAWDSTATAPRRDSDAAQFEDFDLSNVRSVLQMGANVLAIQILNASAADGDLLARAELRATSVTPAPASTGYFTGPTPSSLNGSVSTNLGPIVTGVSHVPRDPADEEELYVTARISPSFAPLGVARVFYRVMWGSEVNLVMLDDGLHGDGLPGDGVFGATIPPAASTNGQMIRYYVSAADNAGRTTRHPPFPNQSFSSQYHGAVVKNPALTNPLEVLHWFIQTPGAADNDAGVRCSMYFLGEFYDNVLFNWHGQSSRSFPKKSYDIDFNPDHNFRWKAGESRVDDVNLLTTYPDKAQMRNILSYEMYRDSGPRAPHHYVVPVRVQMNSQFHGTWHIVENGDGNYLKRIGRDPNGALYKIYTENAGAVGTAEKKTRKTENKDDLQAMVTATTTLTGTALRQYLFDNVDVSEVVNKMAAYAMTANVDCCHKNYYYYRDSEGDGEWEMLPWDVDLSFGRNWRGACSCYWDDQMYWDNDLFVGGNSTLVNTLYNGGAVTATRPMYLRRVRTMMDEMLQDTNVPVADRLLEKRISELTNLLAPDGLLDLLKWGTWATAVQGPIATNSPTYQNVEQAAGYMITNYLNPRRVGLFTRSGSIGGSAELPNAQPTNVAINIASVHFNPPSGNQNEEYIQLVNPNTIWVDLTGWKLTGAVTHTFQAGVVMPPTGSSNVLYIVPDKKAFRARATAPRGGMGLYVEGPYQGQLSARGETIYLADKTGRIVTTNLYPGAPSGPQRWLRITEIMYHPPAPPPGSTNEAEDFEYIELRNTGPTNISLVGVHFTNGLDFSFTGSAVTNLAPGGYVLVVRNLDAFASRYGANPNVAGAYVGILDNGGENLRLDDAVGEKIHDFSYDNAWYPITDGPGASLVIVNPAADWRTWDFATSWRPSAYDYGSPAATDPGTNAYLPILVYEVLSHSDPPLKDAIKLFNPNAGAVALGGWFLSDDLASPRKFRIPTGTSIVGGSFLTIDETQFNPMPGVPPSFSFSSLGDEAYVFSGDGTNITGWVHGHDFGASENGVPFGRYTNSQAEVHFVSLATTNFAGPNAAPKVGPIVVSEIMYHPPDVPIFGDNTRDEFIELANLSGTSVPLYDGANPTNTWQVRGGIEFNFPTNVILPAGGYAVLVSFYPSNATAAADFRSRNNVPMDVPIYGPFLGKLDNSADRVELRKPDAPVSGVVPYVMVERVDYSDASPWPQAADALGGSLQRLVASGYGNDPTNWVAAAPTGGTPFTGGDAPVITMQPENTSVLATLSASFTVGVSGAPPFVFQWQFNSNNIVGANAQTLTLNNVQTRDAGWYRVVVLGAGGSVESANALLTVNLPATITQHPTNVAIRVPPDTTALVNRSVTFRVFANTMNPPLTFQWQFNGTNLPALHTNHFGVTSNILVITNVVAEHAGAYRCAVTDGAGTIFSLPATLTTQVGPIFILQPQSQTIYQGDPVTLSVMLSNACTGPFNYVWRSNSLVIASNHMVAAYSNSITIFNVPPITNTAFRYRCDVQSPVQPPQGAPSANALITTITTVDRDLDGLNDPWEQRFGLSTNNPADAYFDGDGDGMINLHEFQADTVPTNALSVLKVTDFLLGPGETSFRFLAVSNRTYSVQATDSLTNGPWLSLSNVAAGTTNRTFLITNLPAPPSPRYIRLVTPQQP